MEGSCELSVIQLTDVIFRGHSIEQQKVSANLKAVMGGESSPQVVMASYSSSRCVLMLAMLGSEARILALSLGLHRSNFRGHFWVMS